MPIGNCCLGLVPAIGKNLNLDLVGSETRCYQDIFDAAPFHVVGCNQPKSFLPVGACRRKHDTLALSALRRMKEAWRPTWRPFRLSDWSEKRRHALDRTIQGNCERLASLLQHGFCWRRCTNDYRRPCNQDILHRVYTIS